MHIPQQIARLQEHMIVVPDGGAKAVGPAKGKPRELQKRLDDILRAYQKASVPILAEWWDHESSVRTAELKSLQAKHKRDRQRRGESDKCKHVD